MKLTHTTSLLTAIFLTGCTSNMEHAFYNGIQTQNDGYRTADERAMNPVSSYHTYTKERKELSKKATSADSNSTIDTSQQ